MGWTSGSWNGGLEYCVSLDLINGVDAGLAVLAPGWTSKPLHEGLGLGCSSDLQMKICVLGGLFQALVGSLGPRGKFGWLGGLPSYLGVWHLASDIQSTYN